MAVALLCAATAATAQSALFESRSASLGDGKMDITVREVERRPRASVLDIEIRRIGSSVGSSFFILCSVRRLAQARGGFRHIAKLDEIPGRGQMLVGFLESASDPPAGADAAFGIHAARAQVVELEQFARICDGMK